jgi:hypothetical protein
VLHAAVRFRGSKDAAKDRTVLLQLVEVLAEASFPLTVDKTLAVGLQPAP